MPSYILRTIDPSLWARVKRKAALDGLPLRVIILTLLDLYANGTVGLSRSVTAKLQPDK